MPFNVAAINEAVTAAVPEREALVYRDRRFTYAQLADRANRLANVLLAHDVTVQHEREGLANWESGQDHVALYMYNCNPLPLCIKKERKCLTVIVVKKVRQERIQT